MPHGRSADHRFAKLKDKELEWLLNTMEECLPDAKKRLTMFGEVASSLMRHGDLVDVDRTEIEIDL